MKLNKEQKEAAETLDGPVLVVAGPGTGKTELLSVRAANIMREKKVPGDNILILTYTNAAAKAVKERLAKIVGPEGYKVFAETFHSFANSIILDSEEASEHMRERIQMTDLEKVKCFEYIIDRSPADSVAALRPFGAPYYYVPDIARKISDLKNEGITPAEFEKIAQTARPDGASIQEKHLPRLKGLSFIYKKYEELKEGADKGVFDERGRYDFDDMIMLATKVLTEEPALKAAYREKYKYIMVDEFQDTNGAQLKLLFTLSGGKKANILCVGDDDQSIYRFQGANIANFKMLKEAFPAIKVIRLKNNYRSTSEIINLSSDIIKQIPASERLDGPKELISQRDYKGKHIEFVKFSTEDEEIMYIMNKIKGLAPLNQIAVLVRKRAFILKLIASFLKKGIPYATDGKEDIGGEKRVRQLIDALKLAKTVTDDSGQKDIALFRALSCDFFKIPQRDILSFMRFANMIKRRSHSSLFEIFIASFGVNDLKENGRPTPRETKNLPVLRKVRLGGAHNMHLASWAIHRLIRDADARPLHDMLMGFVKDSDLYKFILGKYGKDRIVITRELRSLTSFINMVKGLTFSRPDLSLSEFLEELETMKTHGIPIKGDLVTATQDGVRIITAHAAKGLEFHSLFIPFCIQDKSWPLRPYPDRLPLPPEILKRKNSATDKAELARLSSFDETRLFYVAASRAKSNLIFTSSPSEDSVTSSFFGTVGADPSPSGIEEETALKEFFKEEKADRLLENTEDVLRDLVKNLVLTPTKLNKYLRCKRQFLYDSLLLLPGPKNASLVFGNCAHKALEDTYRAFKKETKFPGFSFFRNAFLKELGFQGVNRAIENSCLAKLRGLKKWFERIEKNPVRPINLEKKKKITLNNGIIFSGKYDKVEFEDEKKRLIRVIDYKTGKPDGHIKGLAKRGSLMSEECDDYFRQLVAYKMLYEKDTYEPGGHKVSHGVLVFLEPVEKGAPKYNLKKGDYVEKKIAVTGEMVGELESGIGDVWKRLNKLEFDKLPERDNKKCRPCAFSAICWEAD
jgi:DNA helicase-2/ATP-dependent DNA helicase PcrA